MAVIKKWLKLTKLYVVDHKGFNLKNKYHVQNIMNIN